MINDFNNPLLKHLQRKLTFKLFSSCLTHFMAQVGITNKHFYFISQCHSIMFRNEEACLSVIYDARDATLCSRDTSHTMLHSLQQYKRETLVMIERREDKDVSSIQESLLVLTIFPAMIHHHALKPTLYHLSLKHSSIHLHRFTTHKVADKTAALLLQYLQRIKQNNHTLTYQKIRKEQEMRNLIFRRCRIKRNRYTTLYSSRRDTIATYEHIVHLHIFLHIIIKTFRKQNHLYVLKESLIQSIIKPFALMCSHTFVMIMHNYLTAQALQHLNRHKVLIESTASSIRRNIHQLRFDHLHLMPYLP